MIGWGKEPYHRHEYSFFTIKWETEEQCKLLHPILVEEMETCIRNTLARVSGVQIPVKLNQPPPPPTATEADEKTTPVEEKPSEQPSEENPPATKAAPLPVVPSRKKREYRRPIAQTAAESTEEETQPYVPVLAELRNENY